MTLAHKVPSATMVRLGLPATLAPQAPLVIKVLSDLLVWMATRAQRVVKAPWVLSVRRVSAGISDKQVWKGDKVLRAPPAPLELPEEMPIARVRRVKQAPLGRRVKPANRGRRVPPDKQAMSALLANSAILVKRGLKAREATLDKGATRVKRGPKVQMALRAKEAIRVKLGLKVKWVPLGLKGSEVPRVKKPTWEILVLKVLSEHKALSVLSGQKALRVKWEQPAQWARKGLAVQSVLKVWRA